MQAPIIGAFALTLVGLRLVLRSTDDALAVRASAERWLTLPLREILAVGDGGIAAITLGPAIVCLLAGLAWLVARPTWKRVAGETTRGFLIGGVFGVGMFGLGMFINATPLSVGGWAASAEGVLEAAVFEEILFRSLVLGLPLAVVPLLWRRLPNRWFWAPICVSAVLFMLAHPSADTADTRIWYLFSGVVLGRLFVSQGVLPPVVAHAVYNACAISSHL